MNTMVIKRELTRIAKNIPNTDEYHNHQLVIAFQTSIVK
jgi:hypothetical protein